MYMYTCTYVHIHIHIHMHVYTYMKHAWEPPSLTTGPLTGVGLAALESPAVEIRLIRVPTCDWHETNVSDVLLSEEPCAPLWAYARLAKWEPGSLGAQPEATLIDWVTPLDKGKPAKFSARGFLLAWSLPTWHGCTAIIVFCIQRVNNAPPPWTSLAKSNFGEKRMVRLAFHPSQEILG